MNVELRFSLHGIRAIQKKKKNPHLEKKKKKPKYAGNFSLRHCFYCACCFSDNLSKQRS